MALPPFLQPLPQLNSLNDSFRHALFPHEDPLGSTHALWWPPRRADLSPCKVLLFIPGNPGLVQFYVPFLVAVHANEASGRLGILAQSHVGHTPNISRNDNVECYGLSFQLKNVLDAFDAIDSTYGQQTSIFVVGHSVGSWLAMQVLKLREQKVGGLFLLFPTISHIGSTPNGRKLSWLFPHARLVANLSKILSFLPLQLLISILFRSWPKDQILILKSFLLSPSSIYASLSMANNEMDIIRDLDAELLQTWCHRIWLYFAANDDWVGDEKAAILRCFAHDPGNVRIVHDKHDIPHAYCINHGEQVAIQCCEWLRSCN